MNLKKPKFWLKKNLLSYILYPFSLITHQYNYFKKLSLKKKFNIKTICIGNIYMGGTGKTSLTIEINKLVKKKFKTIIIKKKYANQKDEINLLRKHGLLISTEDRIKSLKIAEKKKFELALLDDGLQQKNINYNMKIVCFNSEEFIGNEFIFPAGPLRESINEIKQHDIAFFIGEKNSQMFHKKLRLVNKNIKIFEAKYIPKNLKDFKKNKKYLMFCGIGNPQEFENTLNKYNLNIEKKYIFGDHYKFSDISISNLKKKAKTNKLNIITTEKDYLRLNRNQRKGIKFLKVKLKIKNLNQFKEYLNKLK